jgi:hypothetical protein
VYIWGKLEFTCPGKGVGSEKIENSLSFTLGQRQHAEIKNNKQTKRRYEDTTKAK